MSYNYIILLYTWVHGYSRLNPNLDSTVDSQSYILTTTEKTKKKKMLTFYIDLIYGPNYQILNPKKCSIPKIF